MNKENIDAQEEHAFDLMDDLLDTASWRQGVVVLKTPKTLFFCYDIPKLRRALTELALAAVNQKFKQCDCDLDPVVQNAIDEYSKELRRFRIFERTPARLQKAQ